MSVYDQYGSVMDVFSLWRERKVIVAFTRHMGCRFCKEQVMMLQRCRVDFLSGEDIQTVIVSIGNYKDIPRFREETGFAGEIYVDTDLMSPKCFQLLRFENGKHVLFQDPEGTQIHPRTIEAAQRSSVSLPDGGYGLDDNPYTGDTLQIGGVLVLGPGNACDYIFRSTYVGDIPDMQQVFAAAMGVVPITLVDTVYPQALEWNSKLKSDTKLDTLPSTLDISGSAALSSSCPVVSHSVKPEAVKDTSSLRYAALVGIGAVLLFAPKEVEGPVFAAVALMTSVLLFCLRPRLQSITTLQNKAKNGIELLTMRQLDEIVMLRGGKKCECGFIKNIDMSVLKAPETALTHDGQINLEVPADQQQALEMMQCYVREFLAKPNPLLGRKGPTCPFVPGSLKLDSIFLGLVTQEQAGDMQSMEAVVMDMLERFKSMEPKVGPKAQHKAIILIFPHITLEEAPKMIDGLQKKLKPLFVSEGLMVGEFHKLNNACGLHNSNFFPLRTPTPCLAIRNMVPSDIVFLNGAEFSVEIRRSMLSRYLQRFGDSSRNDEQSEVARNMFKTLS